jgi:hypothetical protein
MNVHRGSFPQKAVNGGEIEELVKTLDAGTPEDHLCDVPCFHNGGDRDRDISPARTDYLGIQVLREL